MSEKSRQLFILDGSDVSSPEDMAMLQALYSRNPGSITEKLKEIDTDKGGNLMQKFYIGYGHQSIGDCGGFTMFIENVSMVAAKVIQHHPLYNGQEASTRYLDFSKQGYVDPLGMPEAMEHLIDGYKRTLISLIDTLKIEHPYVEGEMSVTRSEWEKAIKAHAFDRARGLLPLGAKTSLSWHTSFRNFIDHLKRISTHPAREINRLTNELFSIASSRYPKSFPKILEYPALPYFSSLMPTTMKERNKEEPYVVHSFLPESQINFLIHHTLDRPRGQPLHTDLDSNVWLKVRWMIDYGSFRDLQRHRNMKIPLPVVEQNAEYDAWYIKEVGQTGQKVLEERAKYQHYRSVYHQADGQYYYPMCSMVEVPMVMSLGQAVYLVETRSSKTVHPTLRILAQQLGYFLKNKWPKLNVHIDESIIELNLKRGKQDIMKKEES